MRSHVPVAVLIALVAGTAPAIAQTCVGRDLMAEWAKEAPERATQVRTTADAQPNGRHLMWKIENAEAPDRLASYLFATLPVTDDRVQLLSPRLRAILAEVRRIAVEIEDPTPQRRVEAFKALAERGGVLLPAQVTLSGLLSNREAARATFVLSKSGLEPKTSARVKPWIPLILSATSECERSRMVAGRPTLDQTLQLNAESRGLGSIGMETVEMRFRALADIGDDDQLALLKAQLAAYERIDDVTETLIRLYLAKDLAALWVFQAKLGEDAGIDLAVLERWRRVTIAERNTRMLGRIHGHLKRGGLLVATNALQVPGPDGMIEQLRASGFTVTPLD